MRPTSVPVLPALLVLASALTACSRPDPAKVMSAESLARNVQVLASDAFEGREPASAGEEKTVTWLRDEFAALGLQPGNGDSWFQAVPLVEITANSDATLSFDGKGYSATLNQGKDTVLFTKRVTEAVALEASPLVFVGYGVTAPEAGWDDFKDLDVRGKTLLVLVNDPDFERADAGADSAFKGRRMTYYGRWTYKYEEAARRGAAGVLLIHEDAPAGYGWGVVTGSWTGPQFDLVSADKNMGRAAVEGWITQDAAQALLKAAGQDLAALKATALSKDFRPVELGITASTALTNTIRTQDSRNVVAVLPGRERPDEYVVYLAHWDHLGRNAGLEGDQIFNGAVDNATGTAGLVELARAFKAMGPAPARSVVFLAVTAEESGLLGSRWYGENPVFPLASTVAAINIDAMNVLGATRDVEVVGRGASEMDDLVEAAAKAQGRVIVDEDSPEKGIYYRSDHFNFAKQGVPVLYAEGGLDLVDGGLAAGKAADDRYLANDYHKPSDEYSASWNLSGALQDLQLYFAIGQRLATGEEWPNWREGNEFRAKRDASRKAAGDDADTP
jgi:Zn-dependent M28 family amino/carboxypeptidase